MSATSNAESASDSVRSDHTRPLDITAVYPAPSPHAVDFFEALAAHPRVSLEVLYCMDSYGGRKGWPVPPGTFRHEFMPARRLPGRGEFNVWNPGIIARLNQRPGAGRVFALGGGYSLPTVAVSMRHLRRRRARWFCFAEKPGTGGTAWKSRARNMVLRACMKDCTGIMAHGPLARQAYIDLGFPPARVHDMPYYMRVEDFLSIGRPVASGVPASPLRALYCGRLLDWKGLDWMLDAVGLMDTTPETFRLDIVGEGPERGRLEEKCRAAGLEGIVTFAGEAPWEERIRAFAGHDLLIMPSWTEGWGMVTMEALASGMPVLGTRTGGAAARYLRDGVNGFLLEPRRPEALADRLDWCVKNRTELTAMSLRTRESISDWTPERGAEDFVRIVSGGNADGDARV